MTLEGQRILIVGGSAGIGFATARLVADQGARVVIAGRTRERLDRARARLAASARSEIVDFADRASVDALIERVGPIDHLVLCASGAVASAPFAELDEAAVGAAFANKFWGYWRVARRALSVLAKTGSIVMVTGAAARTAIPGTAALAAVNGAIAAFAKTLSVEIAPRRVNVVSPGLTATEAYAWMDEPRRVAFFRDAAAGLPVGRIGAPEDIAPAIALALSNPFLTGALIDVDGGASLARR